MSSICLATPTAVAIKVTLDIGPNHITNALPPDNLAHNIDCLMAGPFREKTIEAVQEIQFVDSL